MDFTHIEHQAAVDGLKAAGSRVNLVSFTFLCENSTTFVFCFQLIRRLAPPIMEEIQLNKPPNAHLGFSVAGGISHEHIKGFKIYFILKS